MFINPTVGGGKRRAAKRRSEIHKGDKFNFFFPKTPHGGYQFCKFEEDKPNYSK